MGYEAYRLGPIEIPDGDAVASTHVRVAGLEHNEGAARFVEDDVIESELLI